MDWCVCFLPRLSNTDASGFLWQQLLTLWVGRSCRPPTCSIGIWQPRKHLACSLMVAWYAVALALLRKLPKDSFFGEGGAAGSPTCAECAPALSSSTLTLPYGSVVPASPSPLEDWLLFLRASQTQCVAHNIVDPGKLRSFSWWSRRWRMASFKSFGTPFSPALKLKYCHKIAKLVS